MSKINLASYNIFKAENEIYLSVEDAHLFKISGDDCFIIELILERVGLGMNVKAISKDLTVKYSIDESLTGQCIDWLLRNNVIIELEEDVDKKIKTVNFVLAGFFDNENLKLETISKQLSTPQLEYNLLGVLNFSDDTKFIPAENADLIVVFSPLLIKRQTIKEIAKYCHEKAIPVLHVGLSNDMMTLGPIFDSSMETPCLECFFIRKLQNLNNLADQLTFLKIEEKKRISTYSVLNNSFTDIAIEFIKIELGEFFNAKSSKLLGKVFTLNQRSYEAQCVILYKVPSCTVCVSHSIVKAFN